jgi:solute carrier family 25 2-oxodicarboxylate transporter 21
MRKAQLIRNAVWNGVYFASIPFVKANLWEPKTESSELFRNFLAGFVGGTLGTTLNTPLDVVKSRTQNLRGTPQWSLISLAQLYKEEGFRAMYKGYVPRILRLGPGGGIMLLAFEFISKLIA